MSNFDMSALRWKVARGKTGGGLVAAFANANAASEYAQSETTIDRGLKLYLFADGYLVVEYRMGVITGPNSAQQTPRHI